MIVSSAISRPLRDKLETGPDLVPIASASVTCPKCKHALSGLSPSALAALSSCPVCGLGLQVTVFPSYGRGPSVGQAGVNRVGETDAACFFHPTKRAEVPCDRCGRYLCALCQLELEGQNLCPSCLSTGGAQGSILALEKERFRWDSLVWMLVLGPPLTICFWMLTPFTCLAAIVIGIWKYRSPPSRICRSQIRLVAGVVTALVLLIGGGVMLTIGITSGL